MSTTQTPTTTSTTTPTEPQTTLLSSSPYSSTYGRNSLYGGSSLYGGGGLYNSPSSYGMMGMNRFSQNQNFNQQNGGLRQDYQQVFQGLRAMLQMGFSAFGLYTYGKMFGNMMFKILKFSLRKCKDLGKKILALTLFNRFSTKILNGVFRKLGREMGVF